jgi:hypothetical protein
VKKALIFLLVLSLVINAFAFLRFSRVPDVHFVVNSEANSRPTYFSIHNIAPAQEVASGQGIKVGILDHYFGYETHGDLYAGGVDFLGDSSSFRDISEHGYWMAGVLREIAPDCQVYALNTMHGNPEKKVEAMAAAIDWAIAEDLDILTYSGPLIPSIHRGGLDEAIERAHAHGIVTTFIHCDHDANLFPDGLFPYDQNVYSREPDVNIFHYDYNVLLLSTYSRYQQLSSPPVNGDGAPYFSLSSTSPVTAGFVALLMEIRGDLKPDQYREILMAAGSEIDFHDPIFERALHAKRAVDMGRAMRILQEMPD